MNIIDLHGTIDARDWAREFVRINGGDEQLMIGWFANAIMAGYDYRRGPLNGDHAQFLLDKQALPKESDGSKEGK